MTRSWFVALAGLVAVRIALPLVALGAAGHDLPGLPRYDYAPLNGDANGFYAQARELISAVAGPGGAIALALVVAGAFSVRRLGRSWTAVAAGALAVSLAATALVAFTEPAGSAVVGWPLLWSIVLFPLRLAGALDPDTAFALGFPLQLAAIGVAIVATAYAGFYATGRRAVGLGAAALLAAWPLLTRPISGTSAWENGQWNVDVGLHLYTEPVSTALVASGLALLLSPRATDVRLALAGAILGFATVVKVSNAMLAVAAIALIAGRLGPRRALPAALAGLAFVPLFGAFWPKGYPEIPQKPGWSAAYVDTSWSDSLIFSPVMLLVLAPLALVGALRLQHRPYALGLLAAAIVPTAVLYSFYESTAVHPRFLYAALPALFVLEAAGALGVRKEPGSRPGAGLRSGLPQ